MANLSTSEQRAYGMACVYAIDAIRYYVIIAPHDHSAHALVNEVLQWSSGGEATWESVQGIAKVVRYRFLTLTEICDSLGATTGALAAARLALEAVLILADGNSENLVARSYHALAATKEAMNSLFRNGVALGVINYLQKSSPSPA